MPSCTSSSDTVLQPPKPLSDPHPAVTPPPELRAPSRFIPEAAATDLLAPAPSRTPAPTPALPCATATSPQPPLPLWQRWATFLARERMLHAAAIGFVLLAVFVPRVPTNTRARQDRAALFSSQHCVDCVWAGDSRIASALRADVLAQQLPAPRCRDFSFPMARFTTGYLDALERLPDPASPLRAIVLGITPHALTESSSSANWFERLRAQHEFNSTFAIAIPPPVRIEQLPAALRRTAEEARTLQVHGDVPAGDFAQQKAADLARYRRTYAENRVRPAAVARLTARVQAWTAAGIRVFAFRPPVCAEMLAVEQASEFDEADFIARFTAAGGTWIDMPHTGHDTSDGTHLTYDAAAQISAQVATILRGSLRTLDPPPN